MEFLAGLLIGGELRLTTAYWTASGEKHCQGQAHLAFSSFLCVVLEGRVSFWDSGIEL